jgi:uncharacterized protein (TIGR02217 family)
MLSERFPTNVSRGASGGPGFKTTIHTTRSGVEKRNIDWEFARGRWNVSLDMRPFSDINTVRSLFYNAKGMAETFRFKDWSDYLSGSGTVAASEAIGTGDGVDTTFQLVKTYSITGSSYVRDITKPVASTVRVFVNGVEQTLTTHYTLNANTGVITFVSPVPNGQAVTAIYEFDVLARFDQDQLDPVVQVALNVYSSGTVNIIEVIGE